jgi:hypothetical protein
VIADMYQCSGHYGRPSESSIGKYQAELVELLAGGHVAEYEFGFLDSDRRVLSWRYRVSGGQLVGGDDRSGGIYSRADVATSDFFNFLTYSSAWNSLTSAQRLDVKGRYDVNRVDGDGPADGQGYWMTDRTYTSGGVTFGRSTFRPS